MARFHAEKSRNKRKNLYVHVIDDYSFTLHKNKDEAVVGSNPLILSDFSPECFRMVFSPWKKSRVKIDELEGDIINQFNLYREDAQGNSRYLNGLGKTKISSGLKGGFIEQISGWSVT